VDLREKTTASEESVKDCRNFSVSDFEKLGGKL